MTDNKDEIYKSLPEQPLDDFWLDQGRKMIEGSISAINDAAKSIITVLGLLNTLYMAILGFTDLATLFSCSSLKLLLALPLICWIGALYFALKVIMTKERKIKALSPESIENAYKEILHEKQGELSRAFWLISVGIIIAAVLFVGRYTV